MSDDLTARLVEFAAPRTSKEDVESPIKEFEEFLAKQKRAFAVEEFVLKKSDVMDDEAWCEWFANHPGEEEAFVGLFMVRPDDKPYFDELWAGWIAKKEEDG